MPKAHATLLREMHLALLAEFGARTIYEDLARRTRDDQLRSVLERLSQEESQQIEALREVMVALGGSPPERSRRRRLLAGLLARCSALGGRRLVLRICTQAAEKASRWYTYFRPILVQAARDDLAATCAGLSETKRRQAQALGAWVSNL